MLKTLDLRGKSEGLTENLPRPSISQNLPIDVVQDIISQVKDKGDAALVDYTKRFDGVSLDHLEVDQQELKQAFESLPQDLRQALVAARESIRDFHEHQKNDPKTYMRDGVVVREILKPVKRAGCYVPGGRASYPSTVLMTAIPALVAGVKEVIVCVPPDKDGKVSPVTLGAAYCAGVHRVFSVGGAQAVAAMAFGTESVPKVDVIAGPGNIYVSLAQRQVAGQVGVPSAFAGPSEVVVIADETTNYDYAAIDVVVQAEHGPHGLAWLITWSAQAGEKINNAIEKLVELSPRKQEIISTLEEGGYIVLVDGPEQAMQISNEIAPEHLELMNSDPESLVEMITNAGAIFMGPYSPASVGDYIAGPSHVLPTYGSAHFASALGIDDFIKHLHVIELDQQGLNKVAPHVVAIAQAEGLVAHSESVRLRWKG